MIEARRGRWPAQGDQPCNFDLNLGNLHNSQENCAIDFTSTFLNGSKVFFTIDMGRIQSIT